MKILILNWKKTENNKEFLSCLIIRTKLTKMDKFINDIYSLFLKITRLNLQPKLLLSINLKESNKKVSFREQVEQGLFPYFDLLCEATNPMKSKLSLKFSFITIYNNFITEHLSNRFTTLKIIK